MFVWSVKGSTLKFIGIICLAAVLMITLLVFVPKNSAAVAENEKENAGETLPEKEEDAEPTVTVYNFDKVKSNSDRVKFLAQFGIEVDKSPEKECVVKIPREFDALMQSYNGLQKKQGLDLEKYAGQEAVRYTYLVTNAPEGDGETYANIILIKGQVIAGDVVSLDAGYIKELGGAIPEAADEPETEQTTETEQMEN
ncbi:MAG: DUF4830 domain-containing protein [Clostridia bacterium]|nr:DUF4830 domain-containing protein [Clostridia bacterium]